MLTYTKLRSFGKESVKPLPLAMFVLWTISLKAHVPFPHKTLHSVVEKGAKIIQPCLHMLSFGGGGGGRGRG